MSAGDLRTTASAGRANKTQTAGRRAALPGPSRGWAFEPPGGPEHPSIIAVRKALGEPSETYAEELLKFKLMLRKTSDMIGPAAPAIYADYARQLFALSKKIVADDTMSPRHKRSFLCRAFDLMVIVYKCLSLVECDSDGAKSMYGYSHAALKSLLSPVEGMCKQLAAAVHDAHSLTVLNDVMSTYTQRMSQAETERDMMELFRAAAGLASDDLPGGDATRGGGGGDRLPRGVERYRDPYPEVAELVERLYNNDAGEEYARDLHDALFLTATANAAAASLSSAIQTRMSDKDRNIVWFHAPGDRTFAAAVCASAIGYLRRRLRAGHIVGDHDVDGDDAETYRINYGHVFSKYRGESEQNFDAMMGWIKDRVRGGDRFRIFWFPDVENLMSPRAGNDQEHVATIKNSFLQHMDAFNKDPTLRSYLLLFHSSEGPLDDAFARRLTSRFGTGDDPLTDRAVAEQVVRAELSRFHINATDELVARVAAGAGTAEQGSTRVGGHAYVQATLREMYVEQKLVLAHGARVVDVSDPAVGGGLVEVLRRYAPKYDDLYGLDERKMRSSEVGSLAFSSASRMATLFDSAARSIKYNGKMRDDPKAIDDRAAAGTLFLHDVRAEASVVYDNNG